MSVYMIVEALEVMDKKKYGEYIRKVPATIERFGGRYLVRGGEVTLVHGGWKPSRLIIVEFASMDTFNAWFHSPEYGAIAPLREQGARTNAIVLEGGDPGDGK